MCYDPNRRTIKFLIGVTATAFDRVDAAVRQDYFKPKGPPLIIGYDISAIVAAR
jgi:hypothetical protein